MAGRKQSVKPSPAAIEFTKAYDRIRATARALDRAIPGSGDRLRMDAAAAVQGVLMRAQPGAPTPRVGGA